MGLLPDALAATLRQYAQHYTWEYTLQHGEILVFNNQRMVHGRRGFQTTGTAARHFIGGYTDAMATLNRYRLLLRQHHHHPPRRRRRRRPRSRPRRTPHDDNDNDDDDDNDNDNDNDYYGK